MGTIRWHIIEGEAGCRYALEHGCVAVVVDALRASATAAMLLDAGAKEVLAVREVETARRAKEADPEALLYGERGGLPPEGFDFGNNPQEAAPARGRRVIFTTTTGAGRLVACWGAKAVYMGAPVNARAVAHAAGGHGVDVVLIPAGLMHDPAYDAQEDRVGAVEIAMRVPQIALGEGRALFEKWSQRIAQEGLTALFESAPHAQSLYDVGMGSDVAYCAQADITDAVPMGVARNEYGVILRNGR